MVVDGLIPLNEDASLLISRFQEYMEYDDIRYFVMKAVTESIGQVMQKTKEVRTPTLLLGWVWMNTCSEARTLCAKQGGTTGIWEDFGSRSKCAHLKALFFLCFQGMSTMHKTVFSLKLEVVQDRYVVLAKPPGLGSSFCFTQISVAQVA